MQAQESGPASKKRVAGIDGLRGFAALYILLFHQLQEFDLGNSFLNRFVRFGGSSVPLFFVISGFILLPSILKASNTDPKWISNFYIKRFFRIIPLWWAVLIIFSFITWISPAALVANLLMVFGFVSYDPTFTPITPAWSLFVEECFYILIPLFVIRFRREANLIIGLLVSFLIYRIWVDCASTWGVPVENGFIERSPLANFYLFFIGMTIAVSFENERGRKWLHYFFSGRRRWLMGVLALVFFFGPIFRFQTPLALGSGLLIITVLSSRTFLSKIFEWEPLCWAGRRCYSIYIGQVVLDASLMPLRIKMAAIFKGELTPLIFRLYWLPIFSVLLLIAAEISWRIWERPWIRFGHGIVSQRQSTADSENQR